MCVCVCSVVSGQMYLWRRGGTQKQRSDHVICKTFSQSLTMTPPTTCKCFMTLDYTTFKLATISFNTESNFMVFISRYKYLLDETCIQFTYSWITTVISINKSILENWKFSNVELRNFWIEVKNHYQAMMIKIFLYFNR